MRKVSRYVIVMLAVFAAWVLSEGIAVRLSSPKPLTTSEDISRASGEILNPDSDQYADITGLAMQAKDFSISNQKFQQVVDNFVLSGYRQEDAVQQTKVLLAEKYAMYHEALQHGFKGRLECVLDSIEQTKAGIEEASNRGDYEAFLEGIGMTSEEYWESQIDDMMMYDAIHCYQESLQEAFESTNPFTEATPEESQQQWEEYYQACVDQAVENQEIEYLR